MLFELLRSLRGVVSRTLLPKGDVQQICEGES
jgi:hypothetical protein